MPIDEANANQQPATAGILLIKASGDDWKEEQHWMGGKGKVLMRQSPLGGLAEEFEEVHLGDIVMSPGAYCGYHVHEGWMEILHVLSGKAEHFENGHIRTLEAGDTVMVGRAGGAHAFRNAGEAELRAVGWFALPKAAKGSVTTAPLPVAIAHWASS